LRSHGDEERTEHRLLAQKEVIDAKLAKIKAAKSPATAQATRTAAQHEPEEAVAKDYGDQRVVIKFFYEQFGSPPESEWKGRYGTVSRIRLRMGDCAPKADTVHRTLVRLAAGDEDISSKPHSGGGVSLLSADEDILVGLLACRGFSQPMALQFLNLQRYEAGLDPVSLSTLRRAEVRVQLLRRKRRSQKAGSVDLDSAWALASLAQSVQLLAQFKAGAARCGEAPPPTPAPQAPAMDGPTLNVGGVRVRTYKSDLWGAIGQTVTVQNSIYALMARLLQLYRCALLAFWQPKGILVMGGTRCRHTHSYVSFTTLL
jgi:hypothetical protein